MRHLSLIAVILLGACSKQAAVERGLVGAGVAAPAANCMAQEMAKRLSADQLQKLGTAARESGKSLSEMTMQDYIATARRVGDAETVIITAAAAAYCDAL